jgi:glucose/mannose transport system substrate-binding protein
MKTKILLLIIALFAALAVGAVNAQDDGMVPVDESVSGDLEVFSWWTSGGEAAALQALFDSYAASFPNANIVNATVAGGGGSAARPVLQTRLAGGDPPDTWQVHPGWELLGQYVDPEYVVPVNDLYEEMGWNDVVPEQLRDMMTRDGNIYLVLAGVHRGNGFWYNKPILDELGVTIGETLSVEEFVAIADQIVADMPDVAPLCVGDSGIWATAQLFENTLLGVLGPDGYRGLWDGSVSFDSDEVKQAMTIYGQMLDYQNSDHAALSWDQAVDALMEGRCVFNSMGDWAYGEFVAAGMEDNVDFGWVSHPGTAGSFMVVADGFVMANGAPNEAANAGWLQVIGSRSAQEAFNPLKGSICARTDCDRELFGPYHNWSMDSFSADQLVASVVHGTAAPADFQQALNDAVTLFVVDRDVDAFSAALVDAVAASGFTEAGM